MKDICEYEYCKYPGKPFDSSKKSKKLWRVIHHIDGNHDNDDPENLMIVHFGCHISLHKTGNQYWGGRKHTEGTRKKISLTNTGKHHSEEAKKKISLAKIGKHLSEETKKKMSLARTGDKNHMYGKHHSEEAKEKISLAMLDNTNTLDHKQTVEHKTRKALSRKIGKNNYAMTENDLIWDGGQLIDVNEIMEMIDEKEIGHDRSC